MRKRKIMIAIIILGLVIILPACINANIDESALIAQHGNMVILKLQILAYEEKYESWPRTLEALKLPSDFKKSINIENIQYPDDKFMFYEKEARQYGVKKGRFFVYKDGFIKFIPIGEVPPERQSAFSDKKSSPISGEEVGYYPNIGEKKQKRLKFIKYYENSVTPVKIIYFYKTGAKKSQDLYRNGKKHGVCTVWDEAGKVLEKKYYKDGVGEQEVPDDDNG